MSESYAGIGSRQTPKDVCKLMEGIGETTPLVLRTGGAQGADTAFEKGCRFAMENYGDAFGLELYLPWKGFGGRYDEYVIRTEPSPEAFDLAAQYHPNWKYLKQGAKKLIARNGHQVLGRDLNDPVVMVVCWTPVDREGGTGQALRIARDYDIPIINLNPDVN